MDWDFGVGDILVLELSDECLVGECVFVNAEKTSVHLRNACDFYNQTKNVSKSIEFFYKSEIKSIRTIQKSTESNDVESDSNIPIIATTLDEMRSGIDTVKILQQIDIRYFDSIKLLTNCDNIGVAFEGVRYGRTSKLSLVTVTDGTAIYIYDIQLLGTLPKELADILQSTKILKIIHDSRCAADNLLHNYKVRLNHVFDTMIASASISGDKIACTLFECISKYFNLPPNNADKLKVNISFYFSYIYLKF